MTCDVCQAEPAVLLIGDTRTGDQTAVCTTCSLGWAISWIEELLPPDARALVGAKLAGVDMTEEPAEEPPRRGGKRARSSNGPPAPEPTEAPTEAAAPTPADS